MFNKTPDQAHVQAIAVLKSAAAEGTLSDVHKTELAELLRTDVRPKIAGTLESDNTQPASTASFVKAPAIVIAQPRHVKEIVERLKLEEGYAGAIETQEFFQLLRGGKKAPDFGQVLKAFTPEMLAAAQDFQNPTLILKTKGRSFDDLVAAMDAHKTMDPQRDVHVDGLYKEYVSQRPENWGAYIIEAPVDPEILDFDDTDLTLGERLKKFTAYKISAVVGGMDRIKYAHAMMEGLKEGRPIDHRFWTMLDEDPALSDFCVPSAGWGPDRTIRRVGFGWDCLEHRYDFYRLRRSVGGDVPNATRSRLSRV